MTVGRGEAGEVGGGGNITCISSQSQQYLEHSWINNPVKLLV